MKEIIRLNFVDMARKAKNKQTMLRVKELTKTKKHIQGRFFKLYKVFKKYKYGEQLEIENDAIGDYDEP